MEKILLIHPDLVMSDKLTFILQHSGFQVVSVSEGKQALAEISRRHPDLIVLAEDTHRLNGDEPCARIRELCQAPILVLGQEECEVAGIGFLEMGADVYLTSPLNLRELLARIHALLRCTQVNVTGPEGDG